MQENINSLVEFFKAYSKFFNLPDGELNRYLYYILLSSLILTISKSIFGLIKKFILWKNQRHLNKDLHPYYSPDDVERTTKYYIPLKYQNVAPNEDEELGRRYIAAAKNKIIPLFLNDIFQNEEGNNKYYLILADTGMGKTTFLINLYIAYKNKFRILFKRQKKYEIKLFPLGNSNTLEEIKSLRDKENTILLLDAFDEDIEAIKDYKKRLDSILSIVYKFRVIILTCRTQFFPSREEEPHETGYFTGGEQGEYQFQKLYLSAFDNKDVKKFLSKRYSKIFQFRKYHRAKIIAEKSPNLVVRPMLLSNIDELLSSRKTYRFSFEIYETLIMRWFERESKKPKIRELFETKENFIRLIASFSKKLAIELYKNREKYGGYYLPREENFPKEISNIFDPQKFDSFFSEKIGKTKSLLNRDAIGNYKFSHKSILEYFLAQELVINHNFFNNFNFSGMDATFNFLKDMFFDKLQHSEGEFSYKEDKKSTQQLSSLTFKKSIFVENLIIKLQDSDCLHLIKLFFPSVKIITIIHKNFIDNVYVLYINLLSFKITIIHFLSEIFKEILLKIDQFEDILQSKEPFYIKLIDFSKIIKSYLDDIKKTHKDNLSYDDLTLIYTPNYVELVNTIKVLTSIKLEHILRLNRQEEFIVFRLYKIFVLNIYDTKELFEVNREAFINELHSFLSLFDSHFFLKSLLEESDGYRYKEITLLVNLLKENNIFSFCNALSEIENSQKKPMILKFLHDIEILKRIIPACKIIY
ncbi:MAG: hypothetical protein C4539_02190 [Ignavibacteriales bacterium]|nr:MAG: hypothetical protein C4539_02190 [Ignavibacteriales bacterium]